MSSRTLGALLAGILGLALLGAASALRAGPTSITAMAGAALFASGFAAFLASWIAPALVDRIRRSWDLQGIEKAPYLLAKRIRKNSRIDEIVIVAYTAKVVHIALRPLADKHCTVARLRILLRDPDDIWNGFENDNAIPSDAKGINRRLSEMEDHLLSDLRHKRKGLEIVTNVQVKFYRGHPTLRTMIVDKRVGFLSVYVKREPDDAGIDWSASKSKVLLLSDDVLYRKFLIRDTLKWFNLVWKHGSREIPKGQIDSLLNRRRPVPDTHGNENAQQQNSPDGG